MCIRDSLHIERRKLRQITDTLLRLLRLLQYIMPIDQNPAFRCSQIACHNIHRRRLSRPIRSQEAIDLPLLDLEVQVIHRHMRTILLHQILHFNQTLYLLLVIDRILVYFIVHIILCRKCVDILRRMCSKLSLIHI